MSNLSNNAIISANQQSFDTNFKIAYSTIVAIIAVLGVIGNFFITIAYKLSIQSHHLVTHYSTETVYFNNRTTYRPQSIVSISNQQANNDSLLFLQSDAHKKTAYKKPALSRMRRTLCSYFILSLGLCDLVICLLVMPIDILTNFDCVRMFLNQVNVSSLCKIGHFLLKIPIILEIEILFTIAFDRYSSVFRPIKLYFFKKSKFFTILLVEIAIAVVISLPNIVFYSESTEKLSMCSLSHDYEIESFYYELFLSILFTINFVFIVTCYIKVYKHIHQANFNQICSNVPIENGSGKRKKHEEIKNKKIDEIEMKDISVKIKQKSNSMKTFKHQDGLQVTKPKRASSAPIILISKTTHNSVQKVNIKSSGDVLMRRHLNKPLSHGKTARTLGLSTMALFLTWLPYWLHVYWPYRYSYFIKNMFYFNYILNPLFYSLNNAKFRNNAYNLFLKYRLCALFNCLFTRRCDNFGYIEKRQHVFNNLQRKL